MNQQPNNESSADPTSPSPRRRPLTVLVCCAKGGVGRTTVATLLSLGLGLIGRAARYVQVREWWEPE